MFWTETICNHFASEDESLVLLFYIFFAQFVTYEERVWYSGITFQLVGWFHHYFFLEFVINVDYDGAQPFRRVVLTKSGQPG